MSILFQYYPGDGLLNLFLIVLFGVTLTASVAWLIARRLAASGALRHLILLSGLMCCLALPAVASFFSAVEVTLVSIPIIATKQPKLAPLSPPLQSDSTRIPPEQLHAPPIAAEVRSPQTNMATDQSATRAPQNPTASAASGTTLSYREIATGVMFISAAGTLLMLARLARKSWHLVQLRRSSHPVRNERLQILIHEVAAKLGMNRIPLVLVSTRTVIPLAVGFGRPAVILPNQLLRVAGDNELRDVLMHEVAHIQRHHQWIVLVQELVGAVYWPIIPIHLLNRELRRANDDLCDNVVLASRDAISYGETLLRVAELLVHARPMRAAVGIIGSSGKLEQRIATLIDPRRNLSTTPGRKAALVVMVMFVTVCAIASMTRFVTSATAADSSRSVSKAPAQDAIAAQAPADADPDDPEFAGHFSGRVTGPDGTPVPHAQIFIAPFARVSTWKWLVRDLGPVRAETDANGRFSFRAADMTYTDVDGLPARRWGLLIAARDGFSPDWMKTWGKDVPVETQWSNPEYGAAFNLQLGNIGVPIQGRFIDTEGRPLAGARVQLTELMIPRWRELDRHLEVEEKNEKVWGSVTYARDLHQPSVLPGVTSETQTDADGRFTMSGLGRDRIARLHVSAPSVVDTTLRVMTRDAPDIGVRRVEGEPEPREIIHGANFNRQLKRGWTVKGRVIDKDTGKAIPGMKVGTLVNAVQRFSPSLYPHVADDQGRFSITGLNPQEKYEIVAVAGPGIPYQTSWVEVKGGDGDAELLIKCERGIPYRLKLVDDQGTPIQAEVSYADLQPNPYTAKMQDEVHWPINRVETSKEGICEGFLLPGPGALLVETKEGRYRPACVDPTAFYAELQSEDAEEGNSTQYATTEALTIGNRRFHDYWYRGAVVSQHDYEAIVLVNVRPDSGSLELSATVVRDTPRQVSLVDPNGNPVVGVKTKGVTVYPYDTEPVLRAASFSLFRLHPDRDQRITFIHKDRQLTGSLEARGDGDSPYTVRMQPSRQ
jgi:beta-lactamase regulating signal transducer with metallopeptidase domain